MSYESEEGQRVDLFLCQRLRSQSRTEISRWIRAGSVTLAGRRVRASQRLKAGDCLRVVEPRTAISSLEPEDIALDVLHEDGDLLVLDKPAGMVVHPGAGNRTGTLVHALLSRGPRWSRVGGTFRPGIVHRLDRATSGVMVVARTDAAHRHLAEQFKNRLVEKEYLALVFGRLDPPRACIKAPIGRHATRRTRMAVRDRGRPARTRYAVLRQFSSVAWIQAFPLTGRTHQIRVHLSSLGHPVVGDGNYGGSGRLKKMPKGPARSRLAALGRLALHAHRLSFTHPASGRRMTFKAPPPPELADLLEELARVDG
ncbi:MAG: RluA family pseudouridine synthase [Acidobacteriota bacterium]